MILPGRRPSGSNPLHPSRGTARGTSVLAFLRGRLATNLPLLARRLQLPIPVGVDLLLTSPSTLPRKHPARINELFLVTRQHLRSRSSRTFSTSSLERKEGRPVRAFVSTLDGTPPFHNRGGNEAKRSSVELRSWLIGQLRQVLLRTRSNDAPTGGRENYSCPIWKLPGAPVQISAAFRPFSYCPSSRLLPS